jgi:leader peptidase (prepilin peptidase) / N-methyltransferase
VGPAATIVTAGLAALSALLLTGQLRALSGVESRWVTSRLHVVLAALGGAWAATLATGTVELATFGLLALGCALLVVIDLADYRLPDLIVGPLLLALLAGLTLQSALTDQWARLGRAGCAAVILSVGYLLLALIRPGGMGLGDVKLAGVLGAFLGWFGWPVLFLGALAGFALGAVCAAVVLLVRRSRRPADLPFGPWMIAGAALGALPGAAALVLG